MPDIKHAEPIYREDDRELLGYVSHIGGVWSALTVFGYEFASATTKEQAMKRVERDGLAIMAGTWQYYDKDAKQWYPCIIKEVRPGKVTVIRTTEFGYQDPDISEWYTITNPDASNMSAPI